MFTLSTHHPSLLQFSYIFFCGFKIGGLKFKIGGHLHQIGTAEQNTDIIITMPSEFAGFKTLWGFPRPPG